MSNHHAYCDGFGRIHDRKLRGRHFSDRYFAGGDGAHPSLGELKTAAVNANVSVFFQHLQHQPGFSAIADKSPDVGLAAGSRACGGTGIRLVRIGPAFLARSEGWVRFVHESTIPGLYPANNSSWVALTPVTGSQVTGGKTRGRSEVGAAVRALALPMMRQTSAKSPLKAMFCVQVRGQEMVYLDITRYIQVKLDFTRRRG